AVTDSNGTVLTSLHTVDDAATAPGSGASEPYLERSSETSALGLRVRASTSLAPLQSAIWRNWICFALVTSLIAVATMTFASPLVRVPKGNDERPTKKRRQANDDMGAETHQRNSEINHLTRSEEAVHPHASQQRGDDTEPRLRMALESAGMCAWEWQRDNGSMFWGSSC